MCLNHQRITLPRFSCWLVQPAFPFLPFLVLPFVNASLAQIESLSCGFGSQMTLRCLFVCGNQQRRIIEPLFHGDFKADVLPIEFSSILHDTCHVPSAALVFGGSE